MSAVVEASDLVVGYHRPLLRIDRFRIEAGERWFVLGPNGAGKTALLRTLSGLMPPLGGRIHRPDAASYIGQAALSAAHLSIAVEEYVDLGRLGSAAPAAVEQALRGMGLREQRRARLHRLSGGERRRVQLARALVANPSLLFLDEPAAGLDRASADRLYAWLVETKTAALISTHDEEAAGSAGTHVARIEGEALRVGLTT